MIEANIGGESVSGQNKMLRALGLAGLVCLGVMASGSQEVPLCDTHAFADGGRILLPDRYLKISQGRKLDVVGSSFGPGEPDAYIHSFSIGFVDGKYSAIYPLYDPNHVIEDYNREALSRRSEYPLGIIDFGDRVSITGGLNQCVFPPETYFVKLKSIQEVGE